MIQGLRIERFCQSYRVSPHSRVVSSGNFTCFGELSSNEISTNAILWKFSQIICFCWKYQVANHSILRKLQNPKNLSVEGFQLLSCLHFIAVRNGNVQKITKIIKWGWCEIHKLWNLTRFKFWSLPNRRTDMARSYANCRKNVWKL